VAVYSMGVDNPERVEVPVGTAAPASGTQPPKNASAEKYYLLWPLAVAP